MKKKRERHEVDTPEAGKPVTGRGGPAGERQAAWHGGTQILNGMQRPAGAPMSHVAAGRSCRLVSMLACA